MTEYTPTRVYQYTSTLGQGNVVADGAAVYPSFFTVDEMAFTAGDTGVVLLQDGDDVEFSEFTVITVSPFEFSRDTVLASRISGVAGTTKLDLSGSATIQFVLYGSKYDSKISKDATAQISAGYTISPYSIGTLGATLTPDPANGNYQYATAGATACVISPPTSDCAIDILITNSSAGGITFEGSGAWTVGANTGDAYDTTGTNKFILSIRRINGVSTYVWKALQ